MNSRLKAGYRPLFRLHFHLLQSIVFFRELPCYLGSYQYNNSEGAVSIVYGEHCKREHRKRGSKVGN